MEIKIIYNEDEIQYSVKNAITRYLETNIEDQVAENDQLLDYIDQEIEEFISTNGFKDLVKSVIDNNTEIIKESVKDILIDKLKNNVF